MKLTVAKDYSNGACDQTCTCELTLKEIYETFDVSFASDNSVTKKMIKQGEGYQNAGQEGTTCTLKLTKVTDGAGDSERTLLKEEQDRTYIRISTALQISSASLTLWLSGVLPFSRLAAAAREPCCRRIVWGGVM